MQYLDNDIGAEFDLRYPLPQEESSLVCTYEDVVLTDPTELLFQQVMQKAEAPSSARAAHRLSSIAEVVLAMFYIITWLPKKICLINPLTPHPHPPPHSPTHTPQ